MLFNEFDKDGGGTIDEYELKQLFKFTESEDDQVKFKELLREFDLDGDGELDFGEFKKSVIYIVFGAKYAENYV